MDRSDSIVTRYTVKIIVPSYQKYCENNLQNIIVTILGSNISGTVRTVLKLKGVGKVQ